MSEKKIETLFPNLVAAELISARSKNAPFNSAHEAYSIILEEIDEFWDEVKKKRAERDRTTMLLELIQIAAMAQRAAEDLGFVVQCTERRLRRSKPLAISSNNDERETP